MCAVGVSSWRKVSAAVLYAVVEIPLFREIIQKYKRVRSLFLDRSTGELFFGRGKEFKVSKVVKVFRVAKVLGCFDYF